MTLTQTLAEASANLRYLLVDVLNLYTPGDTITNGDFTVTRGLSPVALGVPGLVQTVTLPNADGGISQSNYSIKVGPGVVLDPGMVVEVGQCEREPALTGRRFLVESVSQNGLALIRKAVASDFTAVDQQGKESM